MKKRLNMDGKKRITLGKLIPKDTTFFEVEKKKDGTLILTPKSDLRETELMLFKDKKALKSLKQGLKDVRKGLFTPINTEFWAGL